MKFSRKTWTCIEAIQSLFFSDDEHALIRSDEILRSIQYAFANTQPSTYSVDPRYQKIANQAVHSFKMIWPSIKVNSPLHPMLWIRLALHASGPPVAKNFLMRLASWRAKSKPGNIFLLVHQNKKSGIWMGRPHRLEGGRKIIGYTLDQIIVHKKFVFKDGLNEYERKWKLKPFLAPHVSRSKTKPTKTVEQACGATALRLLNAAVRKEMKSGAEGLLSSKDEKGKCGCSVSRAVLIKKLKDSNPDLSKYSNPTLLTGLSSIVKFRLGRPPKVDLKSTSI